MPLIRPFRAWRYHPDLISRLNTLLAPPSDTISEPQQRALYQQPYNSIHLSVPATTREADRTLHHWKAQGVLQQDSKPAIYGYYQRFALPGDTTIHCQKGFICFIAVTDWEAGVVLRHEDTIPHSVEDRVELLATIQLQTSPTHGLYTDPDHRLDAFTDASMENPLYDAEDSQQVRHTLSRICDPEVLQEFVEVLRARPVILADGHHRYESSLQYRKHREASVPDASAAYNYHMMYLTNTEEANARVLPMHRLVHQWPTLDLDSVMQKANRYFLVEPLDGIEDIPGAIAEKPGAFGVLSKNRSFRLQLKANMIAHFPRVLPTEVKNLDTTVAHYFFIDRVLGIPYDEQRKSLHLTYEPDFAQSVFQVMEQKAALAIMLQPASIEQVKRICYSGHLMPQKSTYFYPKTVSGLVFGSIRSDEL